MNNIILGNIISFFASLFLFGSCLVKTRKRVHLFQFFQGATLAVSQIVFGKGGGAVSMSVAAVRNLLICFDLYGTGVMIALVALTLTLGVRLNTFGAVGLLPVAVGAFYSVVSNRARSVIGVKLGLSVLLFVWTVYSAMILDFFGALTNGIGFVLNAVTLVRMHKSANAGSSEDAESEKGKTVG